MVGDDVGMERELEIVLFGATGFVGELAAAHLVRAAGPGARVALAGRSLARLEAVRDRLGEHAGGWELVEVDAMDAAGLRRLASRTKVLASTVGPYARYGRHVVAAAAEEGTHYTDLTGEVLFVRWTLDEVATRAVQTGARIVHSCGFDSVPSDLGVLLTAELAAAEGQGTLAEATLVVRVLKGGISGGTIDSFRHQVITTRHDPAVKRVLKDPYGLSPRPADEPGRRRPARRGLGARLRRLVPAERDPGTGRWLGPFVMAGYNARLVRLSNALNDWSYGRSFRYRERTDFGSGPAAPVRATGMAVGLGALLAGMSWAPTRALLDRLLPEPGAGPSAEQRNAGRFRMEIAATTTTGARYRTTVAAEHDPGYGGTAIMFAESALCLARDASRLPARAGVLTPSTGLGEVLVERLRGQGFTFEAERLA